MKKYSTYYAIANKADKENFYQKLRSKIESAIWNELTIGQNKYLEVEVNIVPVKAEIEVEE